MSDNSNDLRKLFDKFTVGDEPIYLKDMDLTNLSLKELCNLHNILNTVLAYVSLAFNSMQRCEVRLKDDGEPMLMVDSIVGHIPVEPNEDGSLNPIIARNLMASHYKAHQDLCELYEGLRSFLMGELFTTTLSRFRKEQKTYPATNMKFHFCDDDYVLYTYFRPPTKEDD